MYAVIGHGSGLGLKRIACPWNFTVFAVILASINSPSKSRKRIKFGLAEHKLIGLDKYSLAWFREEAFVPG